jgi:YHS domain-containing protein
MDFQPPRYRPKRDTVNAVEIVSESAQIKDPVCGKPVDPLRARAVGIYNGVTRYFCSAECKAKFVDPRQSASVLTEGAVERRRDPTLEGFVDQRAAQATPMSVDRFEDLGPVVQPRRETASPSIQLEVEAMKKPPVWPWVVLVLAGLGAAIWFFGLRG